MRHFVGMLTVVALVGVGGARGGEKDKFDELANEMIVQFTKVVDILESVKDKAGAEAARSKLKDEGGKLKDLLAAGEKLGKPEGKRKEELEAKYKAKFEGMTKRLTVETSRLLSVEGGPELLKDLDMVFGKKGKKLPSPKEIEK